VTVMFVDHLCVDVVGLKAFECELCKVKPSAIKCAGGQWTQDARRRFQQLIGSATVYHADVRDIAAH